MPSVREPDRQPPSGAAEVAREVARDPGGIGPMYHNWNPDQEALRREKPESGTYVVPVDRDLDIADEQLRGQLEDLGRLLAEPGETEADALKHFFDNLLKGGSPSDPDASTEVGNERQRQFYGHEQRGESSEDGDKEEKDDESWRKEKESRAAAAASARTRKIKAARAEVEVETDDDKDEDKKESRSGDDLAAVLQELRGIGKRLSALERGEFAAPVPAARQEIAANAGRSVEAARARAAQVGATESQPAIVRRGQTLDPGHASRALTSETIKLLGATRDPMLRERIKQESSDAITDMQLGLHPLLNDPQLQSLASQLGIKFRTANGYVGVPGGSE